MKMTPGENYSRAEIETGRRLFAGDWRFAAAAGTLAQLPPMRGIEIAFAGRSNVGKSSLINAMTGRHALARTSHTPGRTQELIFFTSEHGLVLVDMPGYGYAAAAKSKVRAWTDLIHEFLRGRSNLARVYLLIDARRGIQAIDDVILTTLDQAAVSFQLVLTKIDQVQSEQLNTVIAASGARLAKHPAAYPELLATSARSGTGIASLRAAVARLLKERHAGVKALRRHDKAEIPDPPP